MINVFCRVAQLRSVWKGQYLLLVCNILRTAGLEVYEQEGSKQPSRDQLLPKQCAC